MIVQNYKGSKSTLLYFESVSSLCNTSPHELNQYLWRQHANYLEQSPSWTGVSGGVKEIREKVELYGWPEGVQKGLAYLGKLTAPKLPIYKRQNKFYSSGHSINMSRLFSGHPETCWKRSQKEFSENKIAKRGGATIVVDLSANAGVNSESFFWRGALACLWAQALVESGRKCRVLALSNSSNMVSPHDNKYQYIQSIVQVKQYTQPIELNRLFSVTSLAGFYRYHIWKAEASIPVKCKGWGSARAPRIELLEPIIDNNPVLLISNIWSAESAKAKAEQLESQMEEWDGKTVYKSRR